MAAKVNITERPPTQKPYRVAGETLAEVWEDIKKKGPKDGGKPRAGYTQAPSEMQPFRFDLAWSQNKDKSKWIAEVTPKDLTFKMVKTKIDVPALATLTKLSKKAQAEWKRFMKELLSHEMEHVAATRDESKKFGGEFLKLKATGEDADKKKALKAAQEAFAKEAAKKHSAAEFQKRLKKANTDLDKGGHGPVLDTSIP